jgi:microcompartment protein CcmL/EutN
MRDPEAVAQRLEEATARAQEVLAETRGTIKDLLAAIKTARGLFKELGQPVMDETIRREMEELQTFVTRHREALAERLTADIKEFMAETARERALHQRAREATAEFDLRNVTREQAIAIIGIMEETKRR